MKVVDPDAGEGGKDKGGDLAGETDCAQQQSRSREAVDEPGGGDAGHPRADEGDALAAEEETEVAMAESAPGVGRGRAGP